MLGGRQIPPGKASIVDISVRPSHRASLHADYDGDQVFP